MPLTNQEQDYYWSTPTAELFRRINTLESKEERERQQEVGLSSSEANLRLAKYGKNIIEGKKKTDFFPLLISQFKRWSFSKVI